MGRLCEICEEENTFGHADVLQYCLTRKRQIGARMMHADDMSSPSGLSEKHLQLILLDEQVTFSCD